MVYGSNLLSLYFDHCLIFNGVLSSGGQLCFHLQVRGSTQFGGPLRSIISHHPPSKGSTRLGAFPYLKMVAQMASRIHCSIKNQTTDKVQRKKIPSVRMVIGFYSLTRSLANFEYC